MSNKGTQGLNLDREAMDDFVSFTKALYTNILDAKNKVDAKAMYLTDDKNIAGNETKEFVEQTELAKQLVTTACNKYEQIANSSLKVLQASHDVSTTHNRSLKDAKAEMAALVAKAKSAGK